MDVLSLFQQLQDPKVLDRLSNQSKASPDAVKKVVEFGLPTLLQAMEKNAANPKGAQSLAKALDDHKDDPIDDIMGFLKNVDTQDGNKILQHVLGSRSKVVESKIASSAGIKTDQVDGIMSQLAPMLLGALGKQKQSQQVDASGLTSMLPMVTALLNKSSSNDLMKMATQFLDADKDGDIMDDVSKMVGKLFKKK